MILPEKFLSCYISINLPGFIVYLVLLLDILRNMRIAIVFSQVVTSKILKLTLSF